MRISYPSVDERPDREPVEPTYSKPRRDPQVTAWVVLSIAFGLFWVLLIGGSVGAKHYYDTSSLPQSATLTREQGIVLFRDAVSSNLMNAPDGLSLREGDDLLVGQGARASLLLFDGTRLQLYSGTELRLTELRKSRLHSGFTRVGVRFDRGMARVDIGDHSTESHEFVATVPQGEALLVNGSYGVLVMDGNSRISSRDGSGRVSAKGKTVEFGPGEKVLVSAGQLSNALPEGDQLVINGDFSKGFSQWQMLDINEAGRDPEPGQRMLVTERVDGRESVAMRVGRVSRKATHNETGLSQTIDKDVSDYQALLLNADVRVDEQTLSGGGYMGYEYPMMIRVRYRDAAGREIDWSHGFFHTNPEERPTPNGQQLPQATWVHYNGDLFEIQPRPVQLISVDVLGAGHSFQSYVANVSLVGK